MNDVNVDNINVEAFKTMNNSRSKYVLRRRVVALGLVLVSMVPFLTGCGKSDANGDDQRPSSSFFSDEDRSKHSVSLDRFSKATDNSLEELAEFGENIESFRLDDCYYITDLSKIPEYCPNIEEVYIMRCPSITDLSFIFRLPNLKKVHIEESVAVTPDLVQYLDDLGIEHNIDDQALKDALEVKQILDEIITDDMTEEEKIQAITYYVVDNYKYRVSKVNESNMKPLSSTLKNKGGVCASYAYLMTVFLNEAGIDAYKVGSNKLIGHAWNLVEVDGKYYYLDATNIVHFPSFLFKFILKKFNIGVYYMTDPRATSFSAMEDFDREKIITIPAELIEDIERGESEKNIYEKYGNSVPARFIEAAFMLAAFKLVLATRKRIAEAFGDAKAEREWKREQERKREKKGRASHR